MKNIDRSIAEEFKIKVINEQSTENECDIIEEEAFGTYRSSNGKYYIKYKVNNHLNMIKVDGAEVTVQRSGEIKSNMKYTAGKVFEFQYNTPYGAIEMSIYTDKLEYALNEDGGVITLEYILDTGGDKYKNNMKIIIER